MSVNGRCEEEGIADPAIRAAVENAVVEAIGQESAQREVGGRAVVASLLLAIENGQLRWTEKGRFSLSEDGEETSPWMFYEPEGCNPRSHYLPCRFLVKFLYGVVYGKAAIPAGCGNCYKVQVQVDTLSQLVALRELSMRLPYPSKCGTELGHRYSRGIWSAFFYADGLDMVYVIHDRLRPMLDGHPELAHSARTSIKRGCTEYEVVLGPSDRWRVDASLGALERDLLGLFEASREGRSNKVTYLNWIETAFRIGDDSYLQLTGGKRLHRPTVDYLARR